MLHELVASRDIHPPIRLQADDRRSARLFIDAPPERYIRYEGRFDLTDSGPDSLCFMDYIETDVGIPVFSSRFKEFYAKAGGGAIRFHECDIFHAGINVLEYIGDDVGYFHVGKMLQAGSDIALIGSGGLSGAPPGQAGDHCLSMPVESRISSARLMATAGFRSACEAAGMRLSFASVETGGAIP